MKQVVLKIAANAKMQLVVNGVTGPACKEITRPAEQALGIVTSTTPTAEYYEQEVVTEEESQ